MINQKNKVIIITSITVLVIFFGLIVSFFGNYIYNLKPQKYMDKFENNFRNQYFSKWILLGFLLNVLIVVNYFAMYLQISNNKTGEEGAKGDMGEMGIKGKDSKTCYEC